MFNLSDNINSIVIFVIIKQLVNPSPLLSINKTNNLSTCQPVYSLTNQITRQPVNSFTCQLTPIYSSIEQITCLLVNSSTCQLTLVYSSTKLPLPYPSESVPADAQQPLPGGCFSPHKPVFCKDLHG